ncbi:RHS repeat-associated core domain-containing protein [Actinokineospora soli]|uniref:RHS repeat-associated core domain-containing protein n=1 Tax=Actinokineospora soli TaxID=1048753 RepID=A0ABW2TNS1_9PSEU
MGAREYDPDLGRFTKVDPIMDLNTPQQLNGYAYSDNNPITFSDPSGLLKSCPDGECYGGPYGNSPGPATTYNPVVDHGDNPSGISGSGCGARACAVGGINPNTVYNGCGARACKFGSIDPHNIDFEPARVLIPSAPEEDPSLGCDSFFNCAWEAGWRGAMYTNPITLVGQAYADLSGTNITPDYVTVDATGVFPVSPRAGIAGASGITVSKHGQLTLNEPRGGAGTLSSGFRNTGITGSARLGWLHDRGADKATVNGFLQGDATNAAGVPPGLARVGLKKLGLVFGVTTANGDGQRAYEYGTVFPSGRSAALTVSHGRVLFAGW